MIDFSTVPSPAFVIDEKLLKSNLELIRKVRQETGAEIILALKGFAMWGIFPLFKQYISKAAASSVNEARLAFEEMGTMAYTYSSAYSPKDFNEIIQYSSHITFNSLNQFDSFLPQIQKAKKDISAGIRINPEYSDVSVDKYNPCATGSRLGVTSDMLPERLPKEIQGFHFHNLCESDSHALEKTLNKVEDKFGKYLHQLKWINIGGGHLMTKKGYSIDHLIKILAEFKNKYKLHVIIEPGAAFVWQAGYLVSTILDIVENNYIKTAMLDVSFAAHMPDCIEMPYKPKIVGATDEIKGKPTYRMGGNTCLAGDYVGNWSFDNELKIGDKIIFEDMAHYTMVKTTMFNGVEHPSIGVWNDIEGFKLIREFGYRDYKNRLS